MVNLIKIIVIENINNSHDLINILNRELAKFKISETYINPKYYDIKLRDYIEMIMQKL